MGKIITYKDGAYSQVMLSSGERIMLSFAPHELKIFKMSWGGLFPTKTILSLGPMKLALLKEFSELFISKFTDYLEPCVTLALTCDSIDEVKKKFSV